MRGAAQQGKDSTTALVALPGKLRRSGVARCTELGVKAAYWCRGGSGSRYRARESGELKRARENGIDWEATQQPKSGWDSATMQPCAVGAKRNGVCRLVNSSEATLMGAFRKARQVENRTGEQNEELDR